MLFLVFFITAFAAVISGNLLGVTYYFDENYFNSFSEKQCVNTTQWELVSYGHLDVAPPSETSLTIRSSRNSCTSSFPIVFFNGTLELTVYLQTISKHSGLTISVFTEHDETVVSVRYRRSNRNFVPGWALLLVPIQKQTTGYVQILGQSLVSELVIVDSLRYIPDNSTYIENDEKKEASHQVKSTKTTNELKEGNKTIQTSFLYDENENNVIEISEDDIDGSGDESTEEPESPEEPDTDEPDPEEDTNTPDPGDNGFWNVFTITFVAVGAFVVVGLVGVGAYYIGVNRGVSQSPLRSPDLESVEPPRIIPRARSVFSDATPYDRFSRYS